MKILLITLSSLAVVACSPAREETKQRTFIEPILTVNEKLAQPYQTPLKNENLSASVRISALAQQESEKRFQFLHAFENRNDKLVGRVEVVNNPFIQFALSSERFRRDDPKTFIKQVEEAHKKGEISGLQWAAFVTAREIYQTTGSTWGLNKFQTKAINQKVAATFPGALGGVNELEKSLPYLLIRKFDGAIDPANSEIQKILASSLPILTKDFYNDMRESLGAAIHNYPLQQNLAETERAASFVLFQRLFSQLLVLKGHTAAKFSVKNGTSSIPLLTDEKVAFDSQLRVGYFMDPKTGKNVALSSDDIANYDPMKRPLLLASNAKSGSALASLDLELKVTSATALAFEASSPAAYFVSGPENYIFGDITQINRAVVPAETHSLAFGLTVMNLKNISGRHIAIVNAEGKDISVAGGTPAGMALFEEQSGQKLVKLENVLKLIELNLQFDVALEQIIKKHEKNPTELKAMHSLYMEPAIILGMRDLRAKLSEMRFPLYLLTMRMVLNDRETLGWDQQKGFSRPVNGAILAERKQRVGKVLVDLGSYLDQPLIIAIGNKLQLGERL